MAAWKKSVERPFAAPPTAANVAFPYLRATLSSSWIQVVAGMQPTSFSFVNRPRTKSWPGGVFSMAAWIRSLK